ncbi:WD40/YVTN/BNR-like repeat-containing protein [Chloroflexota bacterium]
MKIFYRTLIIAILFFISACGQNMDQTDGSVATPSPLVFQTSLPPQSTGDDIVSWINIGPWSNILSIAFDQNSPNRLVAFTPFQMLHSLDAGDNWEAVHGSSNLFSPLYLDKVVIDPHSPNLMYAIEGFIDNLGESTGSGELFKSVDGGRIWLDLGVEIFIDAIALDPIIQGKLFIGTRSFGLLKSDDGGSSWVESEMELDLELGNYPPQFQSISIDPQNPSRLYAGSTSGELFRSDDDGITWKILDTDLSISSVKSIIIDPLSPSSIYSVTGNIGFIRSRDYGENWLTSSNGLMGDVISIAIDPEDAQNLFAGTTENKIFKSMDGGDNWFEVFSPGKSHELYCFQGIREILIDPNNSRRIFALTGGETGRYLLISIDGGNTWITITHDLYASTIESMAIDQNSSRIFTGTRAGLLVTSNMGGKWLETDIKDNIVSIISDPINPDTIYSISDSDIYRSNDQGLHWETITPVEHTYTKASITVSKDNEIIIYAMDFDIPIVSTSKDGGISWNHSEYDRIFHTSFDHLLIDPLSPEILYGASPYDGVFKSIDGGQNWSLINPNLQNLEIFALDPKSSNILFAGTIEEGLFRSLDGGNSWEQINTGLEGDSIQAFTISQDQSKTLYAATDKGIYQSRNSGDNWEPFNTNFPSDIHSINTLLVDPQSMDTLFAGTDLQGIFMIRKE